MLHLFSRFSRAFVLLATILVAVPAAAQLPFFPGAEGYGGAWTGAPPAGGWLSNATVYHVTNLNDSGPGSFRGAFAENSANKIIVFDVGGTIQLTTDSLDIKNLSNYYIAGQTAPSPVTIYGNTTQVTASSNKTTSNVVLRYLSFRKGAGDGEDAITFSGGSTATGNTNIIFDHLSASWSEDEILSVTNYNTNVSVQYTMINDALVSGHAYGSLMRPKMDSNVSFHHNLYANNASRQARFGTYDEKTLTADFRNNVIYNWRDRASYAGGSSEDEREHADVNYVGNYLIAGPGTTGSASRAFTVDKNIDARVYQQGNFIDSDKMVNPGGQPNGSDLGWSAFGLGSLGSPAQTLTQMAAPFPAAPVTTQLADNAYTQVLNHVGNWWWDRDAIDSRVFNNVIQFTGPPIGAAAPNAAELAALLATPMTTRPAGWDSDNDGMPDSWEMQHGLNPNSPAATPDWKLDFDNDGYINLIEYVNERGEFPAPAPIVFTGETSNRFAEIINWRTDDGGVTAGSHWQPSRYDEAVIHSGTVVVDAAGQYANRLRIAPEASDVATLDVTAGWLDVGILDIEVGSEGQGTVNQTGGTVRGSVSLAGPDDAYNLSGGVLVAGVLDVGPGNGFHFTGGALTVADAPSGLENQGGLIAPIGELTVGADFQMQSGVLHLELAGALPGQFKRVAVEGALAAGGTLDVDFIYGFTPAAGDAFDLFDFASSSGSFTLDLPALPNGLHWNTGSLLTTGVLSVSSSAPLNPADFDGNGVVDAVDLAAWSTNFGMPTSATREQGDANGDGAVDGADFLVWQQNLGAGAPQSAAVPEPDAAFLAICVGVVAAFRRARLRCALR